jgi:hypothetical protein
MKEYIILLTNTRMIKINYDLKIIGYLNLPKNGNYDD